MTEICILSLYPWFQGMQAHLCSRTCVLETVARRGRGLEQGGGRGFCTGSDKIECA